MRHGCRTLDSMASEDIEIGCADLELDDLQAGESRLCEVFVTHDKGGLRLDQYLADMFPEISRSAFQKLIDVGSVFVLGKKDLAARVEKKRYRVLVDDRITFSFPSPEPLALEPEDIPLSILYEDEFLLIVNKQPGLVVHPGAGNLTGTFVHGLLHHLGSIDHDDPVRPGIVHRLDKDTSGVLIAAKSSQILAALSKQFADRTVEKRYLALVQGNVLSKMSIDEPIGRHPRERTKMAVLEGGRRAVSIITPIEHFGDSTLVEIEILTGRTHQIRVHLEHAGFPILGDTQYGGARDFHRKIPREPTIRASSNSISSKTKIDKRTRSTSIHVGRQMLHCRMMCFQHPETQKSLVVEAPLFSDMEQIMQTLRT